MIRQQEHQLSKVLSMRGEDERFAALEKLLREEADDREAKQALLSLCTPAGYHPFSCSITKRKWLDLISKGMSALLRRQNGRELFAELVEMFEKLPAILPDAKQLYASHAHLLQIEKPLRISVAMGIFKGQIAVRRPEEHRWGEDAFRKRIMQCEDFFGLVPDISWQLIYVNDGDDRDGRDADRQETTTDVIYRILQAEYSQYLDDGVVKLYRFDHFLQAALGSTHGGSTVYAMRKALDDGAEIVIHNNIDLDCHMALSGNLIAPILKKQAGVVVASNKIKGSIIRDYHKSRRLFSFGFNYCARVLSPIGGIRDPQNAFKAFSSGALEEILPVSSHGIFDKSFDYHFTFANNLIARATARGIGVKEVPSLKHWSAELATPRRIDALYMLRGLWRQRTYHRLYRKESYSPGRGSVTGTIEKNSNDVTLVALEPPSSYKIAEWGRKRQRLPLQDVLKELEAVSRSAQETGLTAHAASALRDILNHIFVEYDRAEALPAVLKLKEQQSGKGVLLYLESFLRVLSIAKPTVVANVLSLFRPEADPIDTVYPEYLDERISQLEALYRINPLIEWRLVVVYEPHVSFSHEKYWMERLQKNFSAFRQSGRVKIIRLPDQLASKSMKGGGIIFGMSEAFADDADIAVYADAKPAVDLVQQGALVAEVAANRQAIALGSRYRSDTEFERSWVRIPMSLAFRRITHLLFPELRALSDTQCPLKAFSREVFSAARPLHYCTTDFDYGLSFDTELLQRAAAVPDLAIKEFPVISKWPHEEGLRLLEAFNMLRGLMGQWRRRSTFRDELMVKSVSNDV